MPWFVHDDRFGPQLPSRFPRFRSGKGNKNPSTESVTLDRFAGGCYIMSANRMMRALQGNFGGSFLSGLRFSPLLALLCVAWVRTQSRSHSATVRKAAKALPPRALRAIGRILGCPSWRS